MNYFVNRIFKTESSYVEIAGNMYLCSNQFYFG